MKRSDRMRGAWRMLAALIVLAGGALTAAAQVPMPPGVTEKTVTVHGAKIFYVEAGSGPVVILLHGLGGDSSNWAANIAALSKNHRVIALDQIGFGRSDKPMLSYRVGTLVDFLDGFYKALNIERATLIGNSLGGFTAAAFALAYPQRVDKLVLVDAAGYSLPKDADPRSLRALNTSTRAGIKQMMATIFYNHSLYTSDPVVDMMYARKIQVNDGYTVRSFIESLAYGEDMLDGKLGQIKQPTLIIWGREDKLTPLSMGERFKQDIPGAQLVVFDQCGHVPQVEKPAEFNAAVLKFLAND